jgi:23S rRNA pseudouridine1911/1915/1917 synthase
LTSVSPPLLQQGLQKLRRQALHAASLGFVHPATGKRLEFSSPLPADVEEAFGLLEELDSVENSFSEVDERRLPRLKK